MTAKSPVGAEHGKIACLTCKRLFKSKQGLTRHTKTCVSAEKKRVDSPKETVKCEHCEGIFTGSRGIATHMRKKHPTEWNEMKLKADTQTRKNLPWSDGDRGVLCLGLREWETSDKELGKYEYLKSVKFPDRSIESIKSQRNSKVFKAFELTFNEATNVPPVENQRQDQTNGSRYILHIEDEVIDWLASEPHGEEYLAIYHHLINGRFSEAGEAADNMFTVLSSKFTPLAKSLRNCNKINKSGCSKRKDGEPKMSPSRRRRRERYGRCQAEWHGNGRSRMIRSILKGKFGKDEPQDPKATEDLISFWSGIFGKESTPDGRAIENARETKDELDDMISIDEVARALKGKPERAKGPDGVPLKWLKELGATKLAILFNGVFCIAKIPDSWRKARTVLIPKVDEPTSPAQYRPITIGSYFYRAYTSILGGRISDSIVPSIRQKGFIKADGIRDNLCLLDGLIYQSKNHIKPLHLAFMDVRKAFDSVSHHSLQRMLAWSGVPPLLREIIGDIYAKSTTEIVGKEVPITVGVKQGDPLSSILFNLTVDMALDQLNEDLGVEYLDGKISYMAFADDLVILARSRAALQQQVTAITERLEKVGLVMNGDKCKSLSIVADGGRKRTYIDQSQRICVGGSIIESMSVTEYYTYLGIGNGAQGVKEENLHAMWKTLLERLTKSPLKPHQKLYSLRLHAYPALQHKCTFQRTTKKCLLELDRVTRKYVRKWMWLPPDTATEAFYARVEDGGLELPSFRHNIPLNRFKRLSKMHDSNDPLVKKLASSEPAKSKIRNAKKLCVVANSPYTCGEELKSKVRDAYWNRCDGKGLRTDPLQVKRSSFGQLSGHTTPLNTKNYVGAWNVRLNTIGTPARNNRAGLAGDAANTCDKCGLGRIATLGHISQTCPETHGSRVKRHDRIVDHLHQALTDMKGVDLVLKEPHIRPKGSALKKPDLIVSTKTTAYIVDVQVVSDAGIQDLERVGERKTEKYGDKETKEEVLRRLNLPLTVPVSVHAFSITWRGNTLRHTLEVASSLGVSHLLPRITTDVLVDTFRMWLGYHRSGKRYYTKHGGKNRRKPSNHAKQP